MITKAESNSIELFQKTGLYLIYGARFRSYTWALQQANMKTQAEQRNKLFEKFTRSCVNSKKFSKWFCRADKEKGMTTRSRKMRFKPVATRTQQYARSPIPQMVELANRLKLPEGMSVKLNSGWIIMM